MVTGFGQIKAAGVHNGQKSFGVLAAVVLQHIDSIAVNGCGSGQQMVLQMNLGHILQIAGIIDDGGIPGVILDQAQHIGFIDVTQFSGFLLGNDDFNIVLQQSVAIVGADLGDGVGVILQTLNDDLAGVAIGFHGNEVGSFFGIVGVIYHVINALGFVQFCLDVVGW